MSNDVRLFLLLIIFLGACQNATSPKNKNAAYMTMNFDDSVEHLDSTEALICNLTPEALQERREKVLASLKNQILDWKEVKWGYALKFPGTDEVIDELTTFIKTERECCGFLQFGLTIRNPQKDVWLELTGPMGAKYLIAMELDLEKS